MTDELNERQRSSAADGSAPPGRSSVPAPGSDEHVDAVALAGYLDRPHDLSADQRASIETHLAACASCREALGELRAVVAAMSALPDADPTRSFALTAEMAGRGARSRAVPVAARDEREPVSIRDSRAWHERRMRAVRWATVAAAMLFVFVLTADIATNQLSGRGDDDGFDAMSVQTNAPEDAAQPAAFEAPAAAAEPTEDAAGSSEALRATGDEARAKATPAAATTQDEPEQAPQAEADAESEAEAEAEPRAEPQEDMLFQEQPEDGAAATATDDDGRSMSTTSQYWRLAQVGLALLIVWLLAAMIVLPRRASGNWE
ncbi:MAG TPA: zf-HC2 domain-containing protein [Thermomicrobiales bacterium]|nr:zf-HC2 domain-containing protein [Thermomicrobiales bacterium]